MWCHVMWCDAVWCGVMCCGVMYACLWFVQETEKQEPMVKGMSFLHVEWINSGSRYPTKTCSTEHQKCSRKISKQGLFLQLIPHSGNMIFNCFPKCCVAFGQMNLISLIVVDLHLLTSSFLIYQLHFDWSSCQNPGWWELHIPSYSCGFSPFLWSKPHFWLVGGLEHFFSPYIGKNHPNWLIFFRGICIPPTRHFWRLNHPCLVGKTHTQQPPCWKENC